MWLQKELVKEYRENVPHTDAAEEPNGKRPGGEKKINGPLRSLQRQRLNPEPRHLRAILLHLMSVPREVVI